MQYNEHNSSAVCTLYEWYCKSTGVQCLYGSNKSYTVLVRLLCRPLKNPSYLSLTQVFHSPFFQQFLYVHEFVHLIHFCVLITLKISDQHCHCCASQSDGGGGGFGSSSSSSLSATSSELSASHSTAWTIYRLGKQTNFHFRCQGAQKQTAKQL